MNKWVLSVIISVFIVSILSIVLPDGKMRNHIKRTFSLLLMIIIIEPIFELKNLKIDFDNFTFDKEVEIQTNYIDFIRDSEVNSIKNNCIKILESISITNPNIELITDESLDNMVEVEKIIVNLKGAVINSEKEHIFIIENIKKVLSEYLKIDSQMVIVNGYDFK